MARHAQIRGDLRDAIDMVAELNRDMVEADLRQLVPDVDRLARAAAQVDCKVVQQGQELARVGACQSDEQLMELADAMREPLPAHSDREIEANQLWRNYATETNAGDEEEDVVVAGADVEVKCPILQSYMLDAVRGSQCRHTFSREGIMSMLGRRASVQCPKPGCPASVAKNMLQDDPRTSAAARRAKAEAEAAQRQGAADAMDL